MLKLDKLFGPALFLAVLLVGAPASSVSFSFMGIFTLTDGDADGFSETLSFSNFIGFGPHSGAITVIDPVSDPILSDAGIETVEIATLSLDPSAPFAFAPTLYVDGFRVFDDGGALLLEADLTVVALEVLGSTGVINSAFSVNLSDVVTFASSPIIDAFASGGSTNLTLQFPGVDLAGAILSGATVNATYSGSAAAVPEPGSLGLLISGLAALCGVRRRA